MTQQGKEPATPTTLDYAKPVADTRSPVVRALLFVSAYAVTHFVATFLCAILADAWEFEFSTREKVANGMLGVLLFPIAQIYPTPNVGAAKVWALLVVNPLCWSVFWYVIVSRFLPKKRPPTC